MDIQNLQGLVDTFTSLGFSPAVENQLLYYACLRQKEFTLSEQKVFGGDSVNYSVFLKDLEGRLVCSYYDAWLRKEIKIDPLTVNGIDSDKLEERMKAIDWKQLSGASFIARVKLTDKKTWEEQMMAENIILDLESLAITVEGKQAAETLRYKYWVDLPLEQLIPNLSLLKSRLELFQRFYIVNGEGITAEEAFRFLNNRWIQRQMQFAKKRGPGNPRTNLQPSKATSGSKSKSSNKQINRASK